MGRIANPWKVFEEEGSINIPMGRESIIVTTSRDMTLLGLNPFRPIYGEISFREKKKKQKSNASWKSAWKPSQP